MRRRLPTTNTSSTENSALLIERGLYLLVKVVTINRWNSLRVPRISTFIDRTATGRTESPRTAVLVTAWLLHPASCDFGAGV